MSKKTLALILLAGLVLFAMTPAGTIPGVIDEMTSGLTEAIVEAIAQAIATAEGFYVGGSRSARNHNPGDLTIDGIGQGVGMDGPFVIYPDDATGWQALYHQVRLMFGGSNVYNPGMTIAQIAAKYTTRGPTGTDQSNWAKIVSHALGVTPDTTLNSLIGV